MPDPAQLAQQLSAMDAPPAERAAMQLVVRLGMALHRYGAHALRIERAMSACARRFGLVGQFFALPTSIHVAFGPLGGQTVFLVRTEPGSQDLGRLAALDALLVRVAAASSSLTEAEHELETILAERRALGLVRELASYALAAASAGVFLGGGGREVIAASGLGLATGAIARTLGQRSDTHVLTEAIAGFVAAFVAAGLGASIDGLAVGKVTLAGIVYLLPGFMLTTAVTEIATRHLASGTARFAGACAVFLALAFGAALGWRIGAACFGSPLIGVEIEPLPAWAVVAALIAAPSAYSVLLRVRTRDVSLVFAACTVAFAGSRLGGAMLGPELGAFCGSLLVSAFANGIARTLNRPSSLVIVPGLFLLVPGSLGFTSLEVLIQQQDVIAGVQNAFRVILVATALASGVMMANVLLPSRRVL